MQIDHINIVGSRAMIEEVRAFYCEVLGMTEGYRPEFAFFGYWLYSEDSPIIHLSVKDRITADDAPGHLDHVAFQVASSDEIECKLNQRGMAYRKQQVPGAGIVQLFFHDPAGIKVEINSRLS